MGVVPTNPTLRDGLRDVGKYSRTILAFLAYFSWIGLAFGCDIRRFQHTC